MENDPSIDTILKAISNKKRLEIFDHILEEKFLIKNELLNRFDLQRAGLDFHLTALEEAGLIGLLDIKIKGRKFVFIYPKATWKIDLDIVETTLLQEFLPSELSGEDFHKLTERLWTDSDLIQNPQTIKKILESLALRLRSGSPGYDCQRCGNEPGIMKCSSCQNLYCTECAEIIRRPNKTKITLCYDCISNQFS
ncbi:MAG: hypothetical protein ACFFB2_09765 [Promethearchaeota archaeon]